MRTKKKEHLQIGDIILKSSVLDLAARGLKVPHYSKILIIIIMVGPSTNVSSEGVIIIIVIYVKWKKRNSPLQICPHCRKSKGPMLYLQQRSVEEMSRIHNARAACPPLELNPDPTVDQSIKYWWNAVSLYLILPPSWHRYRGEEGARAAKMKPCLHCYDSSSRGRCQCPLSLGRIFLLVVSVRKEKKKNRKEKRVASQ